jgi:pullulanase/glycogen debranching enzyme
LLLQVIKAFHSEGLEVVLSVEYSLTAEGSDALTGGLQGMRGIDAATYYRCAFGSNVV